jgi:acyl-CoA thioester hydrolase
MDKKKFPTDGIIVTNLEIIPEWIDYNNHMNVVYYALAFETGFDAYKDLIGMDLDYINSRNLSTVSLESHICYKKEADLDDALRIETRVVNVDHKRAHIYQEMYRKKDLLATQETLSISFNTLTRKTQDFELEIVKNYIRLLNSQKDHAHEVQTNRSIKKLSRSDCVSLNF